MTLTETDSANNLEAYKDSIMRRYELAQTNPRGGNCHDAAYYLLLAVPERGLDGVCYVDPKFFYSVDDLNLAVLIAFGNVYEEKLCSVHLATIHPYNKTRVMHRDLIDERYYPPGKSHNFFWWAIGGFTQRNPMRIQPLQDVQEKWSGFQMHLFNLKPEHINL